MKFLYPSMLWALFLVAIPILIHLLNLRKHVTVYFSNVDFLKKVKRETKKQSKIKQLVLLTCRILALAFLVLAFARPYQPNKDIEKERAQQVVGIYIDNSFSMNAEGPEGKAIENAKQKAHLIGQASQPGTKFILLTNELDLRLNRFYTQQDIINLIGAVEPGYEQAQLSTIVERFSTLTGNFLEETETSLYLISDFQKVTSSTLALKPDTSTTYNLIPVPVNLVANICIDSCWFETPAHYLKQQEELKVRIKNYSSEEYRQIPVKLYINDTLKTIATIDLNAGENIETILTYTNQNTGFQSGKIEISDYPIVYDNAMYFSYLVADKIKVLSIMPGRINSVRQKSIEALFINDNFIDLEVESEERLQISKLSNYATIFLNELRSYPTGLTEALKQFVMNGGTLVFIPDNNGDLNSYNFFLESLGSNTIAKKDTMRVPISKVLFDHPIYQDVFKDEDLKVDFPVIHSRMRFNQSTNLFETNLMEFADNTKALSVSSLGKGRMVVFSFQVSHLANRFTEHLLFVPTFFNLVLTSSSQQQHYHVIEPGQATSVALPTAMQAQNPQMKNLQSGEMLFPTLRKGEGNRITLFLDNLPEAGHYELLLDRQMASILAFNYQLSESDLAFYTSDEMETGFHKAGARNTNVVTAQNEGFNAAIKDLYSGKQFWRLFLLLTLSFLITESLVTKFWKG